MTADVTRRRAIERHRAASLRAVGGDPTAEFRGFRLVSRGRAVGFASPYLSVLHDQAGLDSSGQALTPGAGQNANAAGARSLDTQRGVADTLGLLLRHNDFDLHLRLRPDEAFQRVVFDVLEQIRCEALAPDLPGIKANVEHAFLTWCFNSRRNRVGENGLALLIYTVTHMVRTRLVRAHIDEEVDSIIEATRAGISPIIGTPLRELSSHIDDQAAYAVPAKELASLLHEIVSDAGEQELDDSVADARTRLLLPPEWDDIDIDDVDSSEVDSGGLGRPEPSGGADVVLDSIGGYAVFTRDYDIETTGTALYLPHMRADLRAALDERVAAQAVSPHRLAQRFRLVFGARTNDDWTFDQEDGALDPRRLSQLVSRPENHHVFRRNRTVIRSNTAVTFLVDNSGSMKTQRYETLAVMLDVYSRALDLAGITTEVLGHTTAAWSGGKPVTDWRAAGAPSNPGRLNESLRVIYKDANQSWRRARGSLASMLRPMHFRESLDGEAVGWAHQRLLNRPEPRKILVVVSDGAPMDTATANANGDEYLVDHLIQVVDHIERRSPVEIGAFTIDRDISAVFGASIPIDLDATLTVGTFRALEDLIA